MFFLNFNFGSMKASTIIALMLFVSCLSCQTPSSSSTNTIKQNNKPTPMNDSVKKTDEEWKKILSPEQYYVLREKGTERPGTGDRKSTRLNSSHSQISY